MESKHFHLKTRGEGRYALVWEPSYEQQFNDFLGTIDIGDIIRIAFTSELDECVVVYMSEVVKVERKDEVGQRPQKELPLEVTESLTPSEIGAEEFETIATTDTTPVETPLGEQIDSGTEEADQNMVDNSEQPTLF